MLRSERDTVRNLFEKGTKLPAGECDDEGKTALHLAAMCEDDSKAMEMVCMVFKNIEEKETLVTNRDRRGRTALHEAALNGNEKLCRYLLNVNPKIINLKDRDGRSPIYDAVRGKHNEEDVIQTLLAVYSKRDIPLNALIDRNGLTPLHVAASLGKKDLVKLLLSSAQEASEYLKISDFLGQTALHKATNCGDSDTVQILLKEGAHPLQERDCDGRTALHYAVKVKTGGDKKKMINLLLQGCKTNEEKWLLLWASATAIGTAENGLSSHDPLYQFLVDKKNEIKAHLTTENLLKTATAVGDIEMIKELIARGYQIQDLCDTEWRKGLTPEETKNFERVLRQLQSIAEQGNDRPTVLDNYGTLEYAHGLAAFLLNPYIKPPIVVGISGSWGMAKSSLMLQTERILLKTAAQVSLSPSAKLSGSASELPLITTSELSKTGEKKYEEIKRYVDFERGTRTLFSIMMDKIRSWVGRNNREESRAEIGHTEQDSLVDFLYSYGRKYRKILKSLAAMDRSDMFTTRTREDKEPQNPHSKSMWGRMRNIFTTNYQVSESSLQLSIEKSVPAVLTVQYSPWKYRNETEALAGMAVAIIKELEEIMSEAQWLSTCWRNTWRKKKYNIWIEIIFPCLLSVVLACTITWILWVILDRSEKLKNWAIPKYASLPVAIVIIGWTVTKSVIGILNPVSAKLASYISSIDHTDKLGYQERVLTDISFMLEEIGKKPSMVFTIYSWVSSVTCTLWLLFFGWWITALFFRPLFFGKAVAFPKIAPASGTNLRVIVFIDELDLCEESVILQVLSAINLVLAVCEINVMVGSDKGLIERAIIKKYGDMESNGSFQDNQELADKYLQKIIQLPLDLPNDSEEQYRRFLEEQLDIFQEPEAESSSESTLWDIRARETGSEIVPEVTIDMHPATMATSSPAFCGSRYYWSWIPLKEMLFVRYSKGEQDAFCYFQKLSTDSRKLPIEWKRYLSYHRLVWYIFYLTGEAKDLYGWQVQFITWIFVCWEWQENMNFIIQNWNKVGVLKTVESNEPSLQMIVDHFIKLENKKHTKGTGTSPEKVETKEAIPEAESSKMAQKKSEKASKDIMPGVDAGPLSKTFREELDELKKEIKDLKDQVMKQQSMKNEKEEEEKKMKLKQWQRLRSALDKYDVTMDGILAFQRFRFYCKAGHLSWPPPEQENNEH